MEAGSDSHISADCDSHHIHRVPGVHVHLCWRSGRQVRHCFAQGVSVARTAIFLGGFSYRAGYCSGLYSRARLGSLFLSLFFPAGNLQQLHCQEEATAFAGGQEGRQVAVNHDLRSAFVKIMY